MGGAALLHAKNVEIWKNQGNTGRLLVLFYEKPKDTAVWRVLYRCSADMLRLAVIINPYDKGGGRLCIRNKLLALEYRLVLCTLCGLGILGNLWGANGLYILSYYTIQSNILVWILCLLLVYFGHADIARNGIAGHGGYLPRVKGSITMAILFAGLFYHFFLPREGEFTGISNVLVHYVVPGLCVLDWVLFDPKSSFRWYDPFLWLAVPVCYMLFAFGLAALNVRFPHGGRFPYAFMDLDALGAGGLAFYAFIILACYMLLGQIYYLMDRFLPLARVPKQIKP